jgi:FkbM family methyltransferase
MGKALMGMQHKKETYEPIRFESIRKHLSRGSVVYDIGAYDGITSVLLADIVGPTNVAIVEPAETNWGTIRAYWNAQGFEAPKATYVGFLGSEDKPASRPDKLIYLSSFPPESSAFLVSQYEEYSRFQSIQAPGGRSFLMLDTFSQIAGAPNALTIDVEGAEGCVLRGAERTLRQYRPKVWVSVHPKLMKEQFNQDPESLRKFMSDLGYHESLLLTDQEEHWFFNPKEKI